MPVVMKRLLMRKGFSGLIIPILSLLMFLIAPVSHAATLRHTAGAYHTVAINADGSLWAWGYNFYGQLGDGTTDNRPFPVNIGAGSGWTSVIVGGYHTVAGKKDGTLWAWGYNNTGQIGDGTTEGRHNPVKVGAGHDWAPLNAGQRHVQAGTSETFIRAVSGAL